MPNVHLTNEWQAIASAHAVGPHQEWQYATNWSLAKVQTEREAGRIVTAHSRERNVFYLLAKLAALPPGRPIGAPPVRLKEPESAEAVANHYLLIFELMGPGPWLGPPQDEETPQAT